MNKKEKLAFAVVAALAMTSGGFAFGQSVNNVSSDQVIYACVTGVNGNITKVSNTPKTCPRGTSPISWNMVGPKGDQGLQGVQGEQGLRGATGPIGSLGWEVRDFQSGENFEVVSLSSWRENGWFYSDYVWVATVLVDGAFFRWRQHSGEFTVIRNLDAKGDVTALYYQGENCSGNLYIDPYLASPLESVGFKSKNWKVGQPTSTVANMSSTMVKRSPGDWTCVNGVSPSNDTPLMQLTEVTANLYSGPYGYYLARK